MENKRAVQPEANEPITPPAEGEKEETERGEESEKTPQKNNKPQQPGNPK